MADLLPPMVNGRVCLRPDARPGDPVGGWWIPARCPRCDGPLTHQAGGTPGTETRVVARCPDCRHHYQIKVQILDEGRTLNPRRRWRHAA